MQIPHQRRQVEGRATATRLEVDSRNAQVARTFTRATLTDWGLNLSRDKMAIVVSELAVMAMADADEPIIVALGVRGTVLRAVVADESASLPFQRLSGPMDNGELGLVVVTALAQDWGCYDRPDSGRLMWADLPVDERDYARGGIATDG